ncbi:MAG: hypothetical protein ABL926_11025 [Novosphingobium sp.]|uniref:hypothetical protein n=1 Tax=Novosphingobium sp. TaxID=1874826 RepID=UPI0032B7E683
MRLFHRLAGLSIMLAAATTASAASAPASSRFYGRWAVADERPVFTARGREYKTIDIAPCGKDFCGVSVSDNGRCGAVLFRFLGHRARDEDAQDLRGHGKWGSARKNVLIYAFDDGESPTPKRQIGLYLGEGYDFGERGGSMPKYHADYAHTGAAKCTAR